jgi:hypothetical protein
MQALSEGPLPWVGVVPGPELEPIRDETSFFIAADSKFSLQPARKSALPRQPQPLRRRHVEECGALSKGENAATSESHRLPSNRGLQI